jgi:hypothetical protein
MKKALTLAIAAATLACAAETYTGTVTDSMCGADHKGMNMGTDEKCVTECIKSMGGKYSLWDGKTNWELSDQKGAAKFAAKKVTVKGTADPATKILKVDSIAATK